MEIKDSARIQHILEAAEDIKSFLEGHDESSLSSNKMLFFAISRAIEIIGEASSRVSEETRSRFPGLPWREAIGMRNILIHAYVEVNKEIVWKTATIEIPRLVAEIKLLRLDQLKD
jgi:uncharacterized protein with HEPN domain